MSEIRTLTIPQFHAELKAQGVSSQQHSALICPICKTVQSMASLVKAGASQDEAERMIGFSCEGRLTNAGPMPGNPSAKRKAIRGCDWSLGGLFKLHVLEVEDEEGGKHPRFEVAPPEDAKALEESMKG